MVQFQICLRKNMIGRPEHSLTPYPPASNIISFFPYHPPPTPLKVDVICVSTFIVSKINLQWRCLPAFFLLSCANNFSWKDF